MLSTSKSRYAVRMTTKQGKFLKDKSTGRWTTYSKVPEMSRAEADETYYRCLSNKDGFKYEVIDLDIQDGLDMIEGHVRNRMKADCHYYEKTTEWIKGPDGEHFMRMMNNAVNEAKQKALVQFIVDSA